MTSPVAEKLLTAEEFASTIDPPGMRTELVRGCITARPLPTTRSGALSFRVGAALADFADLHGEGMSSGSAGYLLARNPDTVRAPDSGFISALRLATVGISDDQYFEGAPDLAVEVVSPDDRDADVAEKVAMWLNAGSQRVWEVRPRTRTVTVHEPGKPPRTLGDDATLTSADTGFAVAGFALPVAEIFE
jgi:Uma2 family endonuclease